MSDKMGLWAHGTMAVTFAMLKLDGNFSWSWWGIAAWAFGPHAAAFVYIVLRETFRGRRQ